MKACTAKANHFIHTAGELGYNTIARSLDVSFGLTRTAAVLRIPDQSLTHLEAAPSESTVGPMNFCVGEKVIYPNHGVGIIEKINQRDVAGRQESFYQLKIVSNSMMVMIPTANVADVGLRKLIKKEVVNQLLDHLRKASVTCAADWKNRFKENSEKMRTGCIFDVADVFKGLQALSHTRILSFREKKMLDRARYLLISEVATVWNVPEGKVEELIDRTFVGKESKKANA